MWPLYDQAGLLATFGAKNADAVATLERSLVLVNGRHLRRGADRLQGSEHEQGVTKSQWAKFAGDPANVIDGTDDLVTGFANE